VEASEKLVLPTYHLPCPLLALFPCLFPIMHIEEHQVPHNAEKPPMVRGDTLGILSPQMLQRWVATCQYKPKG
jgi:hypothetical protein